jgi:bifunctional DNA-binding transcriptional regulator/antitoxin component of YhaV-PrlF toxin-antitoxin module
MSITTEFVRMSEKGQLVVPQEIRKSLKLNPGEIFAALPIGDSVLFKKVEMPEIKIDFEKLAKEAQKQFKKSKVRKNDVREAIKWTERES